MANRKWSELSEVAEVQETDRVALQRGATNSVWTFAILRTWLELHFTTITSFLGHTNDPNPHADSASNADLTAHVNASNPHSDSASQTDLNAHVSNVSNPHNVTALQAGADPAGSADAVQNNLDTHEAAGNPHINSASLTDLSNHISGGDHDGRYSLISHTHPDFNQTTPGFTPNPGAGSGTRTLQEDGAWVERGDVSGPASVQTDGNVAAFDGTTGKLIKDTLVPSAALARTDVSQTYQGSSAETFLRINAVSTDARLLLNSLGATSGQRAYCFEARNTELLRFGGCTDGGTVSDVGFEYHHGGGFVYGGAIGGDQGAGTINAKGLFVDGVPAGGGGGSGTLTEVEKDSISVSVGRSKIDFRDTNGATVTVSDDAANDRAIVEIDAPLGTGSGGIGLGTPSNVGELLELSSSAGDGEAVSSGVTPSSILNHIANTSNPHSVTPAQIGAADLSAATNLFDNDPNTVNIHLRGGDAAQLDFEATDANTGRKRVRLEMNDSNLFRLRAQSDAGTPISNPLTYEHTGGFYLDDAAGGSQGPGTLNAKGLFVDGVAVGADAVRSVQEVAGDLPIVNIRRMTQAQYDAGPQNEDTLYVIVG